MYCPQCRTEYRRGFTQCVDCEVELVPELPPEPPPEPKPEYVKYEEVYATYDKGEIAVIKSLLDSRNIMYYFANEQFGSLYPSVQPAKLMVSKDQADDVRELLLDFTKAR